MVTVLEPPWKVGVSLTTDPEEEAIVTLCGSEEELLKSIETLPALALSEVLSNFSSPLGSAASASLVSPPPAGGALVEVVAGAAGAGVDSAVELFLELPQPAAASAAATASAASEVSRKERVLPEGSA